MEFYITFWHLIKKDFTELINHIFFVKNERIHENSNNINDPKKRS